MQQAVRTAFGRTNKDVGIRPDERIVDLGQITITYNRM